MKRLSFTIISGFILLIVVSATFPKINGKGGKAAYEDHYKGTLYYRAGDYNKALQHFHKAHQRAPENFYFSISYGICLSQLGKTNKGLKVIQKASTKLDVHAEDYLEQQALLAFSKGMANIYDEQFDIAYSTLKSGVDIQESIDDGEKKSRRLLSLFYNALGYASVLNQGKNSHLRADVDRHYHVHTRDMIRAHAYFEQALSYDNSNEAAWHNYNIICDSLDLPIKYSYEATNQSQDDEAASESSFIHLPESILSAFDFSYANELLLLLDISGSMVQEKIQCQDTTRFSVMKETALTLAQKTPDSIKLGIGTIGGDCGTKPRLWHPTGQLSQRDMRYAIEFLVPDGTTPLLNMLQKSVELFSSVPNTQKTIFLVSDGANICNAGGVDICEWAESLSSRNITIHILTFLDATFSNTDAFAEYTCLADKTGGDILYLDDLRCNVRHHPTNLLQECQPKIPTLRRIDCWGKSVKNLWGIFPDAIEK